MKAKVMRCGLRMQKKGPDKGKFRITYKNGEACVPSRSAILRHAKRWRHMGSKEHKKHAKKVYEHRRAHMIELRKLLGKARRKTILMTPSPPKAPRRSARLAK